MVAGLYRLPLAEFVAARDRLVRLRAAGDRPAAGRVAALRQPTGSVGAANHLATARHDRHVERSRRRLALVRADQ
jgi:hypothetical protein